MLSKRILYFVEDKIFFHCPSATLSEDCSVSLRWEPYSSVRMLEPFRDYKLLVQDYSKRFLTTQNDAFRAMSGVIRRFSESQQWQIAGGMPTVALENMMLFRRRRHPLSRRPGFPSYSWLGWKGSLVFIEGLYFFEGWIVWHIRDPATGDIFPIERRPISIPQSSPFPDFVASDDIATQRKPDFWLLPGVQMNQEVPSAERLAKLYPRPTFSLLCFSTLAVFFELTDVNYVEGKAGIVNRARSKFTSKIFLDGFDEYPVPHQGEFILLSKTIPSKEDLDEVELGWSLSSKEVYMIMLIEWFNGVAERRGIGFIDAVDIKNSMAPGPVWKEIILG